VVANAIPARYAGRLERCAFAPALFGPGRRSPSTCPVFSGWASTPRP
jgi:hypothetical protein